MARVATGTKTAKSGPMPGRKVLNESGTKEPQDVDRHVGSRVRMQRMAIGMSQEKLGDACGITFQQIQKYEKGTNRMGASRLHQIARILQVPVESYEGVPSGPDGQALADTSSRSMTDFLGTSDGWNRQGIYGCEGCEGPPSHGGSDEGSGAGEQSVI